jgi:hypothetical protein
MEIHQFDAAADQKGVVFQKRVEGLAEGERTLCLSWIRLAQQQEDRSAIS